MSKEPHGGFLLIRVTLYIRVGIVARDEAYDGSVQGVLSSLILGASVPLLWVLIESRVREAFGTVLRAHNLRAAPCGHALYGTSKLVSYAL